MFVNYYDFSIAGIMIRLESYERMEITDAFQKFVVPENIENEPQYTATFQEVSNLPDLQGECVFQDGRVLVYHIEGTRYARVFRDNAGKKDIYAFSSYDFLKKNITIQYLRSSREKFLDIQKAFLHIGWEWILMKEHMGMLHASYVETPYGGILFSGPSGIGKSTQAALWCRYGKGILINGDKTTIAKKENVWLGYGSPYAGSSRCYMNAGCQIKAVFFLKQGSRCECRRMGLMEGFKRVYTGLTINHWDKIYVEEISKLAEQFALDVPVYEFECTADESAVYFLQQMLEKGDLRHDEC